MSSTSYRLREDPFLAWRAATYGALLAAAVLAWWLTALRTQSMMMSDSTGGVAFFLVTWVLMMAAMMFPSVAPMVATFVSIQRGRRAKQMPAPVGATAAFVVGYLVVWSAAGLLALGVLRLVEARFGGTGFWDEDGHWLTATVLVVAAAYELTPLKYACLRRCRSPVGFVLHAWRDGRPGAMQMGSMHGLWCVGCCWGLMAALVALGMMNLGWMALVSVFIAMEKLLPWRRTATGLVTAALLVLAVAVAFAPGSVPGLMA
jgi:predicted metal-binding membrane protein